MNTHTVQVGIIGTGRHGSRYANHLRRDLADRFSLVGISRRSEEGRRQAEDWRVSWWPDWRDLVASPDVAAVIAVTPPTLYPAIGQACAAAGKPLLVEKPLAVNPAEAAAMVELFARRGVGLTVGQTLRYNVIIQGLREFLPRAGSLYSFSANQRLEPSDLPWLTDPEVAGGGVILHSAVHLFDALRFITGREVRRVRATMYSRHNPKLEDLFCGLLEMEDGLVGTVDASKVGPARSGRYEFVGDAGMVQGDQIHATLDFVRQTVVEALPAKAPVSTIVPLLAEWHAFLQGRGENPIPGEEGLAAVRICEACRRSALEDKWIAL